MSTLPTHRGGIVRDAVLGGLPFLIMVVGLLELARAMFVWTTLADSTRRVARAAADTYATGANVNALRDAALFDNTGKLPIGGGIDRDNLKVDYLTSGLATAILPPCPTLNIVNCNADPNGANCVRFVRVRPMKSRGMSHFLSELALFDQPVSLPTLPEDDEHTFISALDRPAVAGIVSGSNHPSPECPAENVAEQFRTAPKQ